MEQGNECGTCVVLKCPGAWGNSAPAVTGIRMPLPVCSDPRLDPFENPPGDGNGVDPVLEHGPRSAACMQGQGM